jgi:flagellar assembly protein FliH
VSFVIVPRAGLAGAATSAGPGTAGTPDIEAEIAGEVARRVRQEVARLRAEASAAGRADAEAAAQAAAQARFAEALAPAVAALQEAWAQLASPLAAQEEALAELVTDLAFSLCRHLFGGETETDPAALRALVARLIAEAASERGARQAIVLRVNPADHDALQTVTLPPGAMLLADSAIKRGGALVEIVEPDGDPIDRIEWDATLETRLEALQEELGLTRRPERAS